MGRPSCDYKTANALGVAAGVNPGTVRYLIDPAKRVTTTAKKPEGYPLLDILGKLADKLGCEVWELLHPDIERSIRERLTYQHFTNMKAAEEPERPGYPRVKAIKSRP